MIPRYTLPEMGRIWSDENRLQCWLQVELAVLEGFCQLGWLTESDLETIRSRMRVSVEEVQARETVTQHDVVAFVESISASLGPLGRYVHLGLTSSDVLDTATAMQLRDSCDQLLRRIDALLAVLRDKAQAYRRVLCVGRTHGVHAEPTVFGLKFLRWYTEFHRHRTRLRATRHRVAVGKISGAVGIYAHVPPEVEAYVCERLGLRVEPVSSQIVPRDRHAEYLQTLALIGASVENVALEIRHLQRTEVREAEEPFGRGQRGSSAMPHKRNPIVAERLCGLARLLRAYATAGLENVALWHERDISHSSVERVVLPDASIALDYMLERLTWLVENLRIAPDRMQVNLALTKGLVYSSGVLVALLRKGGDRLTVYEAIQQSAMRVWDDGISFPEALAAHPVVRQYLSPEEIQALCHPETYLRHVDEIFDRVLSEAPEEEDVPDSCDRSPKT